ncbi:short chain dehydrogenase (predicted) [Planoprotostelium fungivorum]|uniref:Short chain dehydrogenase (Predicted) n=1 Tax=Planoprotostelium fungivorum TaxID=1890364 RepID=A0A2P6MSC6_9EUKA|nr:short chain dehydrogenase (predicted) [Planoprotostelium fungivorum]
MTTTDNNKIWLVTGANRGIGFNLVKNLISRADTIVYAAARDPQKATELQKLATAHKNLHIIKITSGSVEDAKNAAANIEKQSGGLDYVIANAGIAYSNSRLKDVTLEDVNDHFQVNVVGVLVLFQAVLPLLLKRQTRVFEAISSAVASNTNAALFVPFNNGSYSLSKAALNYLVRRISVEHAEENLVAFTVHPGLVETDMAQDFLDRPEAASWKSYAIKPDDSAKALLAVTDKANKEYNGKYLNYDGTELPW